MAPVVAEEIERLGEIRHITELVPSPLNPRQFVDQAKLEELAASIRSKGIIEPLIVRSRAGLWQLEIVAGERRYRAAKLAKLDRLPVIVRTLSDLEVLELMAIENSQRDDLHPLEEANGYAALMKADGAYTPKAIAAKIGKSERYVHQRLQLARLEPDVKKSFLANHITAGHADLMSRLTPPDQKPALKACFDNLFGEDQERGCISVRALNTWIERNIRLNLTTEDPQTELFPEVAKALEKPEDAATILQVAGHYLSDQDAQALKVLGSNSYKSIGGKKDRCPYARRAFVVIGSGRGRLIEVCTAHADCKKHWKWEIESATRQRKEREQQTKNASAISKPLKPSRQAAAARQKYLAAEDLEKARHAAIGAGLKQLKAKRVTPGPPLLKLLAGHFEFHGVKTWTDVAVLALGQCSAYNDREWKQTVALAKPFAIRLDALVITPKAAAQTSATKKAKRKA